jgi:hypothetical protein
MQYSASKKIHPEPARQLISRDLGRTEDNKISAWLNQGAIDGAHFSSAKLESYGTAVKFTENVYNLLITVNEIHARGQSIAGRNVLLNFTAVESCVFLVSSNDLYFFGHGEVLTLLEIQRRRSRRQARINGVFSHGNPCGQGCEHRLFRRRAVHAG